MFYREITLFHFHLYTHSSAISKVSLRPVSNEPNINLESFDANREIEYLQLLVSCASLDAGRVLAVTQKVQKLFEMFFMFWPGMFLHSPKHAKCVWSFFLLKIRKHFKETLCDDEDSINEIPTYIFGGGEWKKVMVWDVCKKHSGLSNMTPCLFPVSHHSTSKSTIRSNVQPFQWQRKIKTMNVMRCDALWQTGRYRKSWTFARLGDFWSDPPLACDGRIWV